MRKGRGHERNDRLPYTLYTVRQAEENKHANATLLSCTNGRAFAVTNDGYVGPGGNLLAQWEEDGTLKALWQVEVGKKTAKVLKLCKGTSTTTSVSLNQVTDRR